VPAICTVKRSRENRYKEANVSERTTCTVEASAINSGRNTVDRKLGNVKAAYAPG
jgi:hypothetical protein